MKVQALLSVVTGRTEIIATALGVTLGLALTLGACETHDQSSIYKAATKKTLVGQPEPFSPAPTVQVTN